MEYTDALIIGVIIATVEVFKFLEAPKKMLPLSAIALGMVGGIFYIYPGDLKAGILTGLIMGLAASGFYSGGKTIIKSESDD